MHFSKLFGIGLPRTGTTSLYQALNQLDISCIHFPFDLYVNSEDRSLLTQYKAFVDAPIPLLYQDLDQAYPGAGFILTKRPLEPWLKSMCWLLDEGRRIWEWKPEYDAYHQTFFGASDFDVQRYQEKYEAYHSEVLDYFSDRENLLILDLEKGYGYEELCQFLEIPVYSAPYPRGNEARQARLLQKLAFATGKASPKLEKTVRCLDYYLSRFKTRVFEH